MAAVVGKYAAKKMLGKQMDKYRDKDVVPYVRRSLSSIRETQANSKKKDLYFALRCNNSLIATRRACIPFFFFFTPEHPHLLPYYPQQHTLYLEVKLT